MVKNEKGDIRPECTDISLIKNDDQAITFLADGSRLRMRGFGDWSNSATDSSIS